MKGTELYQLKITKKLMYALITDGLQSLKSANNSLYGQLPQRSNRPSQTRNEQPSYHRYGGHTNVDKNVQQRLWDVYNTDEYVAYQMMNSSSFPLIVDVTNE